MPNGTQASVNVTGGTENLEVNVYLNSVTLPADGATVRILETGTERVIEELRTDTQGRLPTLSLRTPPLEFSMKPDGPRPFNEYNLLVLLPDFSTASIQKVQLYPNSTALQRVVLRPTSQQIYIPVPVLWGDYPPKIPELEIKPMPLPTDFVVRPELVIPEQLVVHAGVPSDASAPNYTIGFKDYIKNVASSEIYPTWPEEAIKANILAMLSFTLNRVYTEWYRGKGYPFTITNSTAFHQAFTYGRTLYKEISTQVDQLFTTYISKPDILQPLFTQYSDGKKVVRKGWLSQWGTKELADQKYTALQILKNYYGYDIVLEQAEKVQGIPQSYPGSTLTLGATGETVKTIQRQLNAISRHFPAIPKVAVDGVYGEGTTSAVKVFQDVFDLPVTGEVTFSTWCEISNIFVSVEKIS